MPRQSGGVRLNYVSGRDSRRRVEIRWNFHQLVRRGPHSALPRHRAQQHFRVQVLADFVDQLHRVTQRHGNVLRDHRRIAAEFRMIVARPRDARHLYSSLLQQSLQCGRGMLRRLFNGQNQFPRGALRRQTALDHHDIRARLPRERQIRFRVRG